MEDFKLVLKEKIVQDMKKWNKMEHKLVKGGSCQANLFFEKQNVL